jgi:hypothetical protein
MKFVASASVPWDGVKTVQLKINGIERSLGGEAERERPFVKILERRRANLCSK